MSNKFSEPWRYDSGFVVDPDGSVMADIIKSDLRMDEEPVYGERIAACVNACAGIADPADLRRQRDELLAACKAGLAKLRSVRIDNFTHERGCAEIEEQMEAAIANAKEVAHAPQA